MWSAGNPETGEVLPSPRQLPSSSAILEMPSDHSGVLYLSPETGLLQDEEELPGLEEYVVVDQVSSDEEEPSRLSGLRVIDSHFHLDRTSRQIWGNSSGHTVEDLLEYSYSDGVIERSGLPVDVVGGVIVYSEPSTYPPVDFTLQGPWRVAVGVHPKHFETLTVDRKICLQRLLEHPKVVALGECGLDRTIPVVKWRRQGEVFAKLLRMARPAQPLVLHLRGVKEDGYGTDVYRSALVMVEDACSKEQGIHLHCFMGEEDVVRAWLRRFPKTYFGVTAAVRRFDDPQIEGLRAIPRDRLLLDTDSPYFPPAKTRISTPAYIGETAVILAAHLDARTPEILELATSNATALYGL
ncbi:uncharacterized metal-dependent hydrolase YabD-like [Pecten maximus]|uniref:uncharacterized metal-dependent hydrolase YabD-like n=1 Tax=Pecten maximus TaxID=6579 RepID=UPI0014580487|nr:uncharacterized metal-dependent hydrolase YabD-like [Pecten maximus]